MISKGEVIELDDLEIKRPGNGISSLDIMKIVGSVSKNDISKDKVINYEDLIIN